MKENRMIRTAILVLVLILLTTCSIGGTFARYTTGSGGGDSARVAIWGITRDFETPDADGDTMFKAEYSQHVSSRNGDQLVAPGTSDSYTFGMKGTPEVDYRLYLSLGENPVDVTLNPGAYTFAPPYEEMTVKVEAPYLPLVWSVLISTGSGTLEDSAAGDKFEAGKPRTFASLAQIRTALETVTISYDSGESCDARIALSWVWEFEASQGVRTEEDRMDTVLGYYISQAEGTIPALPFDTEDGSAVSEVSYTFQMTAVQMD